MPQDDLVCRTTVVDFLNDSAPPFEKIFPLLKKY